MRPLRIAMVSQDYPPLHGGVAEHVYHLSRELSRRGHHVAVVTGGREMRSKNGLPPNRTNGRPLPRVSHEKGVCIVRVGRTLRIPVNGGSGCVTLGIPPLRRLGVLSTPRFDLVHIHAPLIPTLPLLVLSLFNGPIVATFHSAGRPHWAYRTFKWILNPLSRRITARIGVSRSAVDFVAPFFPGRYRIIPNGVDPSRFFPSPLPNHDGPLTILSVGRLDPRKGIEILFSALPRVQEAVGKRVRCLIVGDGPRRRELQRLAADLRIQATFLGAVDRSLLPEIYRRSHIVVAPARYSESFGVVLLEALASGRPLVASDLPGYRDVLASERGSILFPQGSVDGLVEALSLAAQEQVMERLSREGSEVARRYHWPVVVKEVEEVYGSVLEPEGRGIRSCAGRWPIR